MAEMVVVIVDRATGDVVKVDDGAPVPAHLARVPVEKRLGRLPVRLALYSIPLREV